MTKIGIVRISYELEFKLSTNFTFQTSHVYTITEAEFEKISPRKEPLPDELFGVTIPKEKDQDSPFGYLIIDSTFDLEPYDSLLEGSAKIRPQLLVIHGILTFLTNKVFITFQGIPMVHSVVDRHITFNPKPKKLVANGINRKGDLEKIITKIEISSQEKRILIFTLFERWRKALHFEEESEESFLYFDESVLAYIHILEVLSDEYKKELSAEIKRKRNELINDIVICTSDSGDKSIKKIGVLLNQLNSNQVTLKSKINQMLKEFNLYNLKSDAMISRFVDHRNAIAHGRKNLYQDKVVFPLKPFFSFIKDIDENTETIKILSAKAISSYLALSAWNKEWEFILLIEPSPISLVSEFLCAEKFKTLSVSQFLDGEVDGITPHTLAYYCLKGKIKIKSIEIALEEILISAKLNKRNCQGLFNAAVLLSDSEKITLSKKCRDLIMTVHKRKWGFYSNIRDVIKEHEYHNITLTWFGTWLTNRTKM